MKDLSLLFIPFLLVLSLPSMALRNLERGLLDRVTSYWEDARIDPDFEAGARVARSELKVSNPRYVQRYVSCGESYSWVAERFEAMRSAGAIVDPTWDPWESHSWAWVAGYNDATAEHIGVDLEALDRRTARIVAREEALSTIYWKVQGIPDDLIRLIDRTLLNI